MAGDTLRQTSTRRAAAAAPSSAAQDRKVDFAAMFPVTGVGEARGSWGDDAGALLCRSAPFADAFSVERSAALQAARLTSDAAIATLDNSIYPALLR
ncbi:hypothetical protein [Sphingomonas aurea]|uniref:hypothetical protein n=1 Tax=Sphingomonas aurea TaxID=3063994 RepID=UPI00351D66D4